MASPQTIEHNQTVRPKGTAYLINVSNLQCYYTGWVQSRDMAIAQSSVWLIS